MTARINIGVRHILLVYPFLYVVAARMATVRIGRTWMAPWLTGLLAALSAISSLRAAPYELSYFNELAGGPAGGRHCLGDSNLDWGQGLRGLKAYMDRERIAMVCLSYFGTGMPEDYGIRFQYAPGFGRTEPPPPDTLPDDADREMLAVSVSNLQGMYLRHKELYWWLLARTRVATIAESIDVYDLTGDAEAHWTLSNIYLEEGPILLAIPELQRVLTLRPDDAEAHKKLGGVFRELGRFDEAVAQCRKVLTLEPDLAKNHSDLGSALFGQGRFDEAIGECRKALEIDPRSAEAHCALGTVWEVRGRYDEAVEQFQQALELDPECVEAHNRLGVALASRRQLDEAIRHFREAVRIRPNDVTAHYNLGKALADCGQFDDAVEEYEAVLDFNPWCAEAHESLGDALVRSEAPHVALMHYRKALELATQQHKSR